jgi:hypothetical protein
LLPPSFVQHAGRVKENKKKSKRNGVKKQRKSSTGIAIGIMNSKKILAANTIHRFR